jgi:hypothetical protein
MTKPLITFAIGIVSILSGYLGAACPTYFGSVEQYCKTCKRELSCIDLCGNPPSYSSTTYHCGSIDYVAGCESIQKFRMYCQNCDGDPVTIAWAYSNTCLDGWTCTAGQDCY